MPLNWWHSILAEPIQNRLIGIQPLRDEASLHEAIKNGSAGLLSFSFLDIYLPSQPNLLFALLLLLIATIFSLLILFAVLVRCRLSNSEFFTTNGQETDEKVSHRHSRFRLLLSISIPLWLLLLFGSILFASTLVELISVQSGQDGPIAINEALVMEEDAEMMETGPMGREARDNVGAAGQKMLQKFEAIRELGYQFHSLLSPALFSGWMAFLLLFLLFIFLCTSILSLLAILIGLNQRFRRYSPMVEHFSSKQITSRSLRIRRLLIGTGICLLIAGPAMIGLGSILLVHSHAHSAICVIEQRMNQDGAILEHVQANFATEEDSLALPEFLADLAQERLAVNEENCQKERVPLESLWSATLFLALISVPFGLCLLLISSGWDCPEREGSVSLRAYVPGWLQNSALTPDAYSSIPEMNGLITAQRNHSASQCSFGTGTGTFVYKKY